MTGASAGIGLEFARALAREGMSIVLTARREERLNALAAELRQNFHVETRVVAVDLAAPARLGAGTGALTRVLLSAMLLPTKSGRRRYDAYACSRKAIRSWAKRLHSYRASSHFAALPL